MTRQKKQQLQDSILLKTGKYELVGKSPRMRQICQQIEEIAATDLTVLIQGETGTGKGLVARIIHQLSRRKVQPFIVADCASLSPTLIESELFGHERGAFTGADKRKIGRFELAKSGTLFLDEIGTLPLELQGKLLRVIEEKEFERVGGIKTIKVDTRIIVATNTQLEQAVEENKFRPDLYYRLSGLSLYLPPLRERKGDIPVLTNYFLAKLTASNKQVRIRKISEHLSNVLSCLPWHGNVRELHNYIKCLLTHTHTDIIITKHPPSDFHLHLVPLLRYNISEIVAQGCITLGNLKTLHLLKVYYTTKGNLKICAQILGIHVSTLRRRLKKIGVTRVDHLEDKESLTEISLRELERLYLEQIQSKVKGCREEASRILGIHRNTLRRKMRGR